MSEITIRLKLEDVRRSMDADFILAFRREADGGRAIVTETSAGFRATDAETEKIVEAARRDAGGGKAPPMGCGAKEGDIDLARVIRIAAWAATLGSGCGEDHQVANDLIDDLRRMEGLPPQEPAGDDGRK